MNSTTASNSYTDTTTTNTMDYLFASLVNPIMVIRFFQIGCPITFLLGFIGNTASLITFSRATLRKVSTGCLFIILAISDTLFLLMCVFDFVEFGLQVQFYRRVRYDELCRFRSFVMYVSQVLSSWILVIILIDRWIRTRFPFKSGQLCTPKKAFLAVGVILIVDVGLHSHMLTSLYGTLAPGFANAACGASLFSRNYFTFYLLQWSVVQIVIVCLVPVILMLLILIDIFITVRVHKRNAMQASTTQRGDNRTNQQKTLQLQMFILMLSRISIFLITTLPISLYRIISARDEDLYASIFEITSVWTALGWFQSLNFAINFYTHCLTSTLFRKEFKEQMKLIFATRTNQVGVIELPRSKPRTPNVP